MPELPEVETTLRGIKPYLTGEKITAVTIRQRQLRFPITRGLKKHICHSTIQKLTRRGKYLLIATNTGTLIIHLGMSGHLRILPHGTPPKPHCHFDLSLENNYILRFCDPRKFGSILWTSKNPMQHKLLATLGPEPFDKAFNGEYLHTKTRKRTTAIKNIIMNSNIVTGIGNIYANESLYIAGICPSASAGKISKKRLEKLADSTRMVLKHAIKKGGTTLRDFINEDGKPGYFQASLKVYNRAGKPCFRCHHLIICRTIGQRSSYYCPHCQH